MREKRLEQRYKGAQKYCVAIEGNSWRIMGHTSDMARRGIGFKPSQIIGAPAIGERARVEIALPGKLLIQSGMLVRRNHETMGIRLNDTLTEDVFSVASKDSYSFAVRGKQAWIDGPLDGFLARRDILQAAQSGLTVIARNVSQIDSAGVALLLIALERGAQLAHCSAPVAGIMRVTGACRVCGTCRSHQPR